MIMRKRKEVMMISERTLRKWRKEALTYDSTYSTSKDDKELKSRILKLTQILLDQYLVNKQ
jgi:hypothetical protein